MEKLRPLLPPQRPDTPEYTFNVITWEHGSVVRQYHRWKHKGDTREGRAYLVEMRMAHAGHLIQSILLAEQMGWDLDALLKDGLEEFKERMLDIVRWTTTDREED